MVLLVLLALPGHLLLVLAGEPLLVSAVPGEMCVLSRCFGLLRSSRTCESYSITLKCNFLDQSMRFLSVLEETSSNPARGEACGGQSLSYLPGIADNTSVGKMMTNTEVVFQIGVKAGV